MKYVNSFGTCARAGILSMVLGLTASVAIAADSTSIKIGPDTEQTTIEVKKFQAAADLLPPDFAKGGAISVGLEANGGYPNSVTSESGFYGLTYDLAKELAATLGLELKLNTGPFPTLIPGLQAKRFDFSTSLYGDSEERRQVVDFVYSTLGLGDVLLASTKQKGKILDFKNICGLTIGSTAGSSQLSRVEASSAQCQKDGKPPVTIQQYPSNPETVLAGVSARVDGVVLPMGGAGYAAKANTSKLTLGTIDLTVQKYSGIAMPKGSPLKPAIQAAMAELVRNGIWKQTLTIYGQEATFAEVSIIEKGVPYVSK
ncbi:transporter substrate-binding domain-containing protein [Rhizobium laguerreae]|uniref:transporter substrate-binding domain-containing protein n=1 Tax=Rhizobium laguerreae TaxID=1076926 RepID=UPI001C903F7E|nr:transporter substrate-binding domain-containing protein [Rhizobium laguerreae]MBY3381804.1 transporter substrate-binding domain-containing protein [Rhizobium laguerreae]